MRISWSFRLKPEPSIKKVQLITDGACIGNPGPGGWACILRYGDKTREMYGSEPETTNNRMELKAAVEGLRALKETCSVEIVTDSNYLKNGITEWIHKWKRNGWQTGGKKAVANQDLWHELDEQNSRHKTTWSWTKGHASRAANWRASEPPCLAKTFYRCWKAVTGAASAALTR